MDKVDFIPLGSVVQLYGGTQKLLVVSRALTVQHGEKTYYFDYGGVMYPQGLIGAQMAYFNHDAIRSISFIGCNDTDNQAIVKVLNDSLAKKTDLIRCTPEEWEMANKTE